MGTLRLLAAILLLVGLSGCNKYSLEACQRAVANFAQYNLVFNQCYQSQSCQLVRQDYSIRLNKQKIVEERCREFEQ